MAIVVHAAAEAVRPPAEPGRGKGGGPRFAAVWQQAVRPAGCLGCCPRRGAPPGLGTRRTRRRRLLRSRRGGVVQQESAAHMVLCGGGTLEVRAVASQQRAVEDDFDCKQGTGFFELQAEPGQRRADTVDVVDSKDFLVQI